MAVTVACLALSLMTFSGLRCLALLLAWLGFGGRLGSSTNPGKPVTAIDVDALGNDAKPLIRRAQQQASAFTVPPAASAAVAPSSAVQLQQSVVVDASGASQEGAAEEEPGTERAAIALSPDLQRYMALLESRIKQAWFLHGDAVQLVVDDEPYIISPSKEEAVKHPSDVLQELEAPKDRPESLAKAATEKKAVGFTLWIRDVNALLALAKNFDKENVQLMAEQGKLRGFLKGEEQNKGTVEKLSKTELLSLGWSLTWLVGGFGRQGLLGQAASLLGQAAAVSGSAGSLLQEAHTASYFTKMDQDWFRAMMRSTPTDGFDSMVASHAKDWLTAMART